MTLVAVPNISEGRDARVVSALQGSVSASGARLLDTHSDPVHNRTVLTVTGSDDLLVETMVGLAGAAARLINLETHEGVHPRTGVLDVCPFVPFESTADHAVHAARSAAELMGAAGLPVFLYGMGTERSLPDLRRRGLEGLLGGTLRPDFGPSSIDPQTGCVCVGARGPLIAFNVNIDASVEIARTIAAAIRATSGGPVGLRALGLPMPIGSQVSMNITQPEDAGIRESFAAVETAADRLGAPIISTELVGLAEQRFLPQPDAKAARLMIEPGRSLESALKS